MRASAASHGPKTTSAGRVPERSGAGAALAAGLLAVLLAACGEAPAPGDGAAGADALPPAGETIGAPDPGRVPLLAGGSTSLAELRGRWVFVNYWAEWCAPCREEIPELNHLHEEDADAYVLGVNFDQLDAETMRPQAEALGIRFPVAAVDPSPELGLDLPEVLPSTYVFAPSGERVAILRGPQTLEALRAAMAADR